MVRAISICLLISLAGCGGGDDVAGDPDGGSGAGDAATMDGSTGRRDAGGGTDAGGTVDAGPMMPRDLAPCDTATCWDADGAIERCGMRTIHEDYSTARYNVHAYATTFYGGTTTEVSVTQTAGMFAPAIILRDDAGRTLSDGERGLTDGALVVTVENDGRTGGTASVSVVTDTDLAATVNVTGWTVVDEGFASFLGTDVTYDLTIADTCP